MHWQNILPAPSPLFTISCRRVWMELPACNLHRLIILKPPVPFNYNRCPFWLIVCLHTRARLVLMRSASRGIPFTSFQSVNELQKKPYLCVCGFFSALHGSAPPHMTFPSFEPKNVCLLCRVCLDPPVRRERTETSERWWVLTCVDFAAIRIVCTYGGTWREIVLIVFEDLSATWVWKTASFATKKKDPTESQTWNFKRILWHGEKNNNKSACWMIRVVVIYLDGAVISQHEQIAN